jgi:hypothetical protein
MSVIKKNDLDWRYYLRQLAESSSKISDIERVEFAGLLLKRDLEKGNTRSFIELITFDDCCLGDLIAQFMIAESPESCDDILNTIQTRVVNHYLDEMDELIQDEEKVVADEVKHNNLRERPEPCEEDLSPVRFNS